MSTGDTDVVGDRFRLHERIGSGGTAQVFRATDVELGRDVAVKLVDLRTDLDGDVRRRIQREARRAAKLRHPGVVQVHDVGHEEGRAYIVMEYVTGPTLADELADGGPLAERETAEIGLQVCETLGAAHDAGVVHRDIKPSNILLDGGRARVTDFGIAHAVDDTLTDDTIRGTVGYLAPEQLSGGAVDHRADLYALGILLYELATGRRPFAGETATETAFQRLHTDPRPPSEIAPVSPAFDRFIDRALARDPDQRFQTAAEMHAALDPLTVDPDGDTQPLEFITTAGDDDDVDGSRRWSWWLVLGVLLLAALAVGLGPRVLSGQTGEVPEVSGATIAGASTILEQHGLRVGTITRRPSDRPVGTVLEQVPEPGAAAPEDGTVDLVVAQQPHDGPPTPSETTPTTPPPEEDTTSSQDGPVDTSDEGTQEEPAAPGGGPPEDRGPDGDGPPGQDGEPPGRG